MIAKIGFTVYQDYESYLKEENDYDYTEALNALNEHLKELVDKNELTFLYNGKRVKIILPLDMRCVGNIFGEDGYDGPNWDGVEVPCEINIGSDKFDPSKLRVNKCPCYMDPRCILH